MLHKQTGLLFFEFFWLTFLAINPRAVINEAVRTKTLCGVDREKEIGNLAVYIEDTLSVFQPNKKTMVFFCIKKSLKYFF